MLRSATKHLGLLFGRGNSIPEDIELALVYHLNLAMFVGAPGSVIAIRTGTTVSSDFPRVAGMLVSGFV